MLGLVGAALLCLSALSGCDDCYASGVTILQDCQETGTLAAELAPGIPFACPAHLFWIGSNGKSSLTIDSTCPYEASFSLALSIPRGVSEVSYVLPVPEIGLVAGFYPARPPTGGVDSQPRSFSTDDGSLVLVSGTVVVHSCTDYGGLADNYGVDADVDLHFQASSGDAFSVAGHVLANACVVRRIPWCQAD
jgi:hypothetical protein